MNFLIIMSIICAYSSLSSKIETLINNQNNKNNKIKLPPLKELIDKNIDIEMNDESDLIFDGKTNGILKCFDDKWLVLETINKKNKKELYYYRINNILSIDVIEK